ncbi:hypothetical protein [Rhabdothermincola salaria]|uniref:hypothetical protein n=1 Tax=Rhabdothermincola salaria TaxID=2903142 RepID=UPI001E2F76EA|nr:hypothetical protein [Rhabdothermincola salaria]MCD9624223.1 hypothetical protein [Rhabdothermincola salaria]
MEYTSSYFAGATDDWWTAAMGLVDELGELYQPAVRAAAELRISHHDGPGEYLFVAGKSDGTDELARALKAGQEIRAWFDGRVLIDDALDIAEREADSRYDTVSTGPIPALVVKLVRGLGAAGGFELGDTVTCYVAPIPPRDAERYRDALGQSMTTIICREGQLEVPG